MKIKFILNLFSVLVLSTILTSSCSKDEKSSEKAIISFKINDTAGEIDETKKTISFTVPTGTILTAMKPLIVVSEKATVAPASGEETDFTDPVEYTVTAEDGSSVKYTVTVNEVVPDFTLSITAVKNTSGITTNQFIGNERIVIEGTFAPNYYKNKVSMKAVTGNETYQLTLSPSSTSSRLEVTIPEYVIPDKPYKLTVSAYKQTQTYSQDLTILNYIFEKPYIDTIDPITVSQSGTVTVTGANFGTLENTKIEVMTENLVFIKYIIPETITSTSLTFKPAELAGKKIKIAVIKDRIGTGNIGAEVITITE